MSDNIASNGQNEDIEELEETTKVNRGRRLTCKEKELILRILKYFQLEKEQQHLFVPLTHAYQRTAAACNVSFSTVKKISKDFRIHGEIRPNKKPKRKPPKQFDETAIKNAVLMMYENKEHVTLKTIRERLKELNIFNGGQTSVSYVMKKIGFKFKKDHQFLNKGVFCEQKKPSNKPKTPRKRREKKPIPKETKSETAQVIEISNDTYYEPDKNRQIMNHPENKPRQPTQASMPNPPEYILSHPVQQPIAFNQSDSLVARQFYETDYYRKNTKKTATQNEEMLQSSHNEMLLRHFADNRIKKVDAPMQINTMNMDSGGNVPAHAFNMHKQPETHQTQMHHMFAGLRPNETRAMPTMRPEMYQTPQNMFPNPPNNLHPHFLTQYQSRDKFHTKN